jgi:Protein of unknown function (DUF2934)
LSDPTEEQIRVRAHRIWEIAGRSEVREQEVWYEAERELKGEATGSTINADEKSDTFLE